MKKPIPRYIIRTEKTKTGYVPVVSTKLTIFDTLGAMMMRFSINRMNYKVEPRLYAVGNPAASSPVFVSANYKLSFDSLRKELQDMDAWILVLDTKGINVWCAAGEGTFGTKEIIRRVAKSNLKDVVSHKTLIVPQLGAVGVSAHEVKKESGFNVIYGPVRAHEIPAFMSAGRKATPEMRLVSFNLLDRAKLVGVEVVGGLTYLCIAAVLFLIPGLIRSHGLHAGKAIPVVLNLLFAYLSGSMLGPLLLPWLPGRAFALKGLFSGLIAFAISFFLGFIGKDLMSIAGWAILMMTISSFILMNFTGASTYTSFSGVKKEMKTAVPLQAAGAVASTALIIIHSFI
jgi:hypothetical protein